MRAIRPVVLAQKCVECIRRQSPVNASVNIFTSKIAQIHFIDLVIFWTNRINMVLEPGLDEANRRRIAGEDYFAHPERLTDLYLTPGTPSWAVVTYHMESDIVWDFGFMVSKFSREIMDTDCFNRSIGEIEEGLNEFREEVRRYCL